MTLKYFAWLGIVLSFSCQSLARAGKDDDQPTPEDRENGYRYSLVTAESSKTPMNSKDVANLRGQIGLVYDLKRAGSSSESGVCGQVWRGRARLAGEAFSIRLDHIECGTEYQGQMMAYDATGKDRSVTLQDQNHTATSWKIVRPKEEWFKKHNRLYFAPIQLQATEGKFAGYFLDFSEPELVKVPDKGELKDRSYVRRQAILVQDPSEFSVLVKQEFRQR